MSEDVKVRQAVRQAIQANGQAQRLTQGIKLTAATVSLRFTTYQDGVVVNEQETQPVRLVEAQLGTPLTTLFAKQIGELSKA